ncbi:RICIN domain-containing protein [Microbispora sp. KK1-11]|uniref:RICIN domain-containing protein n=1 Tax=Microbispora sp. KK1-11 TaxID=2053005 RepID=UPI00163CD2A2|nr:RICIN domain-containing protein [Microbispora sp. KK1-11]
MQLRRTLSLAAMWALAAVLIVLPSRASAAAPPDDGPSRVASDVFPGAKIGHRAGPAALPSASAAEAQATPQLVACDGDGTSGKRVEVLYVRESSMPDRYAQLLPMFRAWLADADDQFNDGAATSGRSRHIRYVTTSASGGCAPVVRNLVVPAGSLADFDSGINAVKALGYTSTDRHYLMLTEATVICGVGEIKGDDLTTGAANLNNGLAYARVDAIPGCFGANAIAHELGHTFGAVQMSAAHSDGSWHCLDQWDLMCYGGTPSWNCLQWNDYRLPDCNRDDYYNAAPAAGSYLATHWNTANSAYLIAGSTADSDPHPKVGNTYVVTNVATGGALEPIGASTGTLTELSQRARVDTPSQKWLMGYTTGLQFINVGSRLCADSSYSGTTPGTTLLQYICNGQDGMRFAYLPVGTNTYAIFDWLSGLALTATGSYPSPVTQQTYTGATNQQWVFNQVTGIAPVNNSVYYLQGRGSRDNAEPVGGSTASGTLVTHNPPSGATSQQWRLQATGSYWNLVNVNSAKCLDLVSAGTANGVQIRQATCGTATSQQWTLRRVADGTFYLVNRFSSKVLDSPPGSGTTLEQQTITGNTDGSLGIVAGDQIWHLNPA